MSGTDRILLEQRGEIGKLEKKITQLRKCIVKIHEVIEEGTDQGLMPPGILEAVTGMITEAER